MDNCTELCTKIAQMLRLLKKGGYTHPYYLLRLWETCCTTATWTPPLWLLMPLTSLICRLEVSWPPNRGGTWGQLPKCCSTQPPTRCSSETTLIWTPSMNTSLTPTRNLGTSDIRCLLFQAVSLFPYWCKNFSISQTFLFVCLWRPIFGRQVQCGSILWPGHLDQACDLYFHWGDHQHSHGNYLRLKVWSHLPLLCEMLKFYHFIWYLLNWEFWLGAKIPHRYFASVSSYSQKKFNTLTIRKLIGLKVTSLWVVLQELLHWQ